MTSSLSLCRAALPIMARIARDVTIIAGSLDEHERDLHGKAQAAWQSAHGDALGENLRTHAAAMEHALLRVIKRLEAMR